MIYNAIAPFRSKVACVWIIHVFVVAHIEVEELPVYGPWDGTNMIWVDVNSVLYNLETGLNLKGGSGFAVVRMSLTLAPWLIKRAISVMQRINIRF
jgi:hypothetical protein